jgi:hypothetical protein
VAYSLWILNDLQLKWHLSPCMTSTLCLSVASAVFLHTIWCIFLS